MAEAFLTQLAKYVNKEYGSNFQDVCVVLPGRRAHLFLGEALKKCINGPSFLPRSFSIEEFVFEVSGLVRIDAMHQLVYLYDIIRSQEENPPSFDDFMGWGEILLSDFNDLDLHLTDSELLFQYLSESKAMSLWNPESSELTPFQTNYLKTYAALGKYYLAFRDSLLKNNAVYQGLAYRVLAEKPQQFYDDLPWEKVIMAGFNALNPAEEQIRSKLKKAGKLDMLFDADTYYMEDVTQEAGKFLRQIRKKDGAKDFRWIHSNLSEIDREISVYAVSGKLGMARLMGELMQKSLDKLESDKERQAWLASTVVVVPDPLLLFPVLNCIPKEAGRFNVTMGMSLALTPLASLLEIVFEINDLITENKENIKISSRAFVSLVRHPYIQVLTDLLMPESKIGIMKRLTTILNSGKIMWDKNDIFQTVFDEPSNELKSFFDSVIVGHQASLKVWINQLLLLTRDLQNGFVLSESGQFIEVEYLRVLRKALNEMLSVSDDMINISWIQIKRLLRQTLRSSQASFYGEPLGGLQVMGMLETRTLDFERVYILSVNDDILPAASQSPSMIPFDIRTEKTFELPTFREKNAVFAYHFFHLLQRSSEVHVFYNSQSSGSGGGEPSRFIHQLEAEFLPRNPRTVFKFFPVINHPAPLIHDQFRGKKSDWVIEILKKRAAYGFSPTALNTFISCPLKFYLQYVASINEDDDAAGQIDFRILGQAVHKAVENLVNPCLGQYLELAVVDVDKEKCRSLLSVAFEQIYPGLDVGTGLNLLYFEAASLMLNAYLQSLVRDIKSGHSVRIIASEVEMKRTLEIDVNGELLNVVLRGKADSIEEYDSRVRIVDFKTGNTVPGDTVVDEYAKLMGENPKSKGFQLFMYLWLSDKVYGERISCGIISLKNLSNGFMPLVFNGEEPVSAKCVSDFGDLLTGILNDIFNQQSDFTPTENLKTCEMCNFSGICGR